MTASFPTDFSFVILADPPLYLLPGGDYIVGVDFYNGNGITPIKGSCPLLGGATRLGEGRAGAGGVGLC